MKRTITFVVFTMMLSVLINAQKRNMIPNGDFEKVIGQDSDEFAEWQMGAGLFVTDQDLGETPLRGNYSLQVECQFADKNSILMSRRAFSVARDEVYELKFKAVCEGAEDAVIKPYLECQWDAGHLPGENLFDNKTITLKSDGEMHDYTLRAEALNFISGQEACDYVVFFINFSELEKKDINITIDDIQIIRVDEFGEAMGNINVNPEFTAGKLKHWIYSEKGDRDQLGMDGDKFYFEIELIKSTQAYTCFTGSYYFWKEHDNRNWQVQLDMETDFATSDGKFFINGDEDVFNYLVARDEVTGLTGTGGYTFEIKEGRHTYTFDYLAKDNGGALKADENWGEHFLDLNFGTIEEGNINIYSMYVIEKLEVEGLSIDMPEKVNVGQKVPVDIWSNPTNANNKVELSVNNDNAKVELDNKGVWQYTQLKEGNVVLTATSIENNSVTASKTILSERTAIKEAPATELIYSVDNITGTITIEGLNGNETLELINSMGQLVSSVQGQSVISTATIGTGVYFLRIISNGQAFVKKFVK